MTAPSTRPSYEFPRFSLLLFGLGLIIARRRSFVRDGEVLLRSNPQYPRRIEGVERIPRSGPFILAMNHFSRRGLRPYHVAMIVSVAAAHARPGEPEVRWAFTSEYLGRKVGPVPVPLWFIRWVFRQVARGYGFVIIPRREELVAERAAALRAFGRLLAAGSPIGVTPEGVYGHGPLVEPPPGSGLFLAALARRGVPVLPAGIAEVDGTLVVRFGAPFALSVDSAAPRAEQDRAAAERVMLAIGRELPPSYRGPYAARLGEPGP